MERLEQTNESLAKVFTLGQSYENTTIYGIKVFPKFRYQFSSIRIQR